MKRLTFSALALAVLAMPAVAGARAAGQVPTPAAIMNRYVDAVNSRNYEALRAVLAPNLVQHFSDMGMTSHGSDTVVTRFRSVIKKTPDLRLSLDRVIANGQTFATMIDVTYTENGKPVHAFWIDIWRMSGGVLAEHWES